MLSQVDRAIGIVGCRTARVLGIRIEWQEGGKGEDTDPQIGLPTDMVLQVAVEELEYQQYNVQRQVERKRNHPIDKVLLNSSHNQNDPSHGEPSRWK